MSVEKFIQLVKQNPCLYDPANDHYKNMKLKEDTWTGIASELKRDATTLKKDWKKLRDCHRDAVKRKKSRYDQGAKSVKKWKYDDQMEFLLQYMTSRSSEGLFSDSITHEQDHEASEDSTEEVIWRSPSPCSSLRSSKTLLTKIKNAPLLDFLKTDNVEREGRRQEYHQKVTRQPDRHPLESFFESMCITSKKLPKKYQLEVKKKVFQIVTDAEERAYNDINILTDFHKSIPNMSSYSSPDVTDPHQVSMESPQDDFLINDAINIKEEFL